MVGRRFGSVIEVEESVADRIPEGVADGAASLVPYGALVKRNVFIFGCGEWRRAALARE